jgi:hypothetical protein
VDRHVPQTVRFQALQTLPEPVEAPEGNGAGGERR